MPAGIRSAASDLRTRFARVALVGLLALASHALLPYLHALASSCDQQASCSSEGREPAPSHSSDCPVCSALFHAGSRAADAPQAIAVVSAPVAYDTVALVSIAHPRPVELDCACARAPPASLRNA